MEFSEIQPDLIPMALLLEADPSESHIRTYLTGAWGYVAQDGEEITGACIVIPKAEQVVEVANVSVWPGRQGQGIGTRLLKFVLDRLMERGVKRVELGTGTFGHQLTYYQRLGFRVEAVIQDHFLETYPEPIFEHGIQHKDMLMLAINL